MLLQSVQSLLEGSVQQLKRASNENADNQLQEVKKLKYSEPYRFKEKANEDQYELGSGERNAQGNRKSLHRHCRVEGIYQLLLIVCYTFNPSDISIQGEKKK